ncbi:MAG: hydrogenase maturation protease [Spirochaetia bacterium]|jgi:hydrogenase 3 maturation protease|nr:hydrogenase maturation protease [Spirochaetia bacterium]
MNSMTDTGEATLAEILKGKVVIVGIGNVLKGDDGLGPILSERLKTILDISCINAGSAPENYIGKIVKELPDTVLFIDAAHLGRPAGSFDILESNELMNTGLSTHDVSPGFYLEMLESQIPGRIFLLGIQPEQTAFGIGLSPIVSKTLDLLQEQIIEIISTELQGGDS